MIRRAMLIEIKLGFRITAELMTLARGKGETQQLFLHSNSVPFHSPRSRQNLTAAIGCRDRRLFHFTTFRFGKLLRLATQDRKLRESGRLSLRFRAKTNTALHLRETVRTHSAHKISLTSERPEVRISNGKATMVVRLHALTPADGPPFRAAPCQKRGD